MEQNLTISIKKLQEEIDSDQNNDPIKRDSLRDLTLQMENLRENRIKGSIIRFRANLIDTWEKPSKFFLNIEKKEPCQ